MAAGRSGVRVRVRCLWNWKEGSSDPPCLRKTKSIFLSCGTLMIQTLYLFFLLIHLIKKKKKCVVFPSPFLLLVFLLFFVIALCVKTHCRD